MPPKMMLRRVDMAKEKVAYLHVPASGQLVAYFTMSHQFEFRAKSPIRSSCSDRVQCMRAARHTSSSASSETNRYGSIRAYDPEIHWHRDLVNDNAIKTDHGQRWVATDYHALHCIMSVGQSRNARWRQHVHRLQHSNILCNP